MLILAILCALTIVSSEIIVHEWGTYTSMQGPNGIPMPGLHHGEEKLPDFVHSRASEQKFLAKKRGITPPPLPSATTPKDCYFCEVMDWKPVANTATEVTQKLETPVIYFYTKSTTDINATIEVSFPEGIITETYPRPLQNLPEIGNVKSTSRGYARWSVTVSPFGKSIPIPPVPEENIWAPSRRVSSNYVENSLGESERHIFYRGLGRFFGPVSVKSTMTTMTVENLSEQPIPASWVLSSDGNRGVIYSLGPITPRSSVFTSLDQDGKLLSGASVMDIDTYVNTASDLIAADLEKAGLYTLEARAMVDTWKNSYFRNSGTRVLYIAPRFYPDQVLPLVVEPAPRALKRVLVGRVEVLLQSEVEFLTEATSELIVQHTANDQYFNYIKSLGRFAEPKVRYVLQEKLDELSPQENAVVEKWILDTLTWQ